MQEGEVRFLYFVITDLKTLQASKAVIFLIDESAPWTFDPARLLSCLQTIRKQVIGYWC